MRLIKVLAGALVSLAAIAAVIWWVVRPDIANVRGRRVEVKVLGQGHPAVVFESGFESSRLLWWFAQHRVAKITQTVTYARAGTGESDPSGLPRTAEQIAVELHDLLATLHVAPPYILVGHSAGGLYVRVFAHRYPNELAALVLIDPASAEDYDRMRTQAPAKWAQTSEKLAKLGTRSGLLGQWQSLPESLEQSRRAWPLPAVPTVVLTSTKPTGTWPLESAGDVSAFSRSQTELVQRIRGCSQILVPDTNHLSILGSTAVSDQIVSLIKMGAAAGPKSQPRSAH
jgi:pimeloyl-ACP methyl ester carboxylesterase